MSVQVISYSNPSNRCAGCDGGGCCDNPQGVATSCAALCDNEFLYCLRPFGTPDQSLQVSQTSAEEIAFSARAASCWHITVSECHRDISTRLYSAENRCRMSAWIHWRELCSY